MSRLDRFLDAQSARHDGYATALSEIRSGGKRSHWIWYVFPQLAGLGRSSAAQAYGIEGRDEAAAYLRQSVLRSRLVEITRAVASQLHAGVPIAALMGSDVDTLKLVSSLTLFRGVAEGVDEEVARTAADVLQQAEAQGYPACEFTLTRLGASR